LLMMRSVVGAANDNAPSTTCTSARHAARTHNLVPNNELSNVSQIIENDIVSHNTDQSGSRSRALFDEIDAGINNVRNCSWKAKLRFPLYYCSPDEPLPYSNLYVASDLFELTQEVKGLAGYRPFLCSRSTHGSCCQRIWNNGRDNAIFTSRRGDPAS
jgi:hypothetical protein